MNFEVVFLVISELLPAVMKLFIKMLPKKAQEAVISIYENWRIVNERIKYRHFSSLISQEMVLIDKEKNSVLEHAGLDETAKQDIRQKLMQKRDELYSAISVKFENYYLGRVLSITLFTLTFAGFLFSLWLIYVAYENIPSTDQSYSAVIYTAMIGILAVGLIEQIIKFVTKGTIREYLQMLRGIDFRKALRTNIRFELRKIVNDLYFSLSYKSTLSKVKGAGLEEGYDRLVEVDTEARHYVQKMISGMNHGSFGVAGPRGTGKTTLLHSIQELDDKSKESVYVHLPAPVAYDAREFILYLYAEVCRAIINRLDPQGKEQPHFGRKWSAAHFLKGIFRWENILAFLVVSAIVYYRGDAVLKYYMETLKNYTIDADVLDTILKYNFLVLLVAFLVLVLIFNLFGYFWGSLISIWAPEITLIRSALKKTYGELQKIKYQQTLSDSKSGKLNLSILEASSDQSSTFQEYEMSLPEVTNAYRKFIEEMAGKYRFIIAIDEMDKIDDSLQAQTFLNDLKNILNLESCFYLVSVSENAMSAFELRGLPFRDAFDSTFDEVVHLSYIDLRQTREIISRRLIGFPEPFLQLAYALSGGLPRDLIRITRKMLMSVSENNPAPKLNDVAYMLLQEDLVNKINAVRHQVQEKGLNIKAGSYIIALDLLETNISIDNLNKQGKSLVKSARGFTQKNGLVGIQALFYNLGIYMLYISTLLAFFTQPRTEDDFKLAADSHLDQLVTARQRIGLSSDYALILVNQFHKTFHMPTVKA